MQFDWFTFSAQLINFLILLLLLRRFLYGPITRVMAERQARVTAQLNEARDREEKADRTLAEVEKKLEGIEQERKTVLEGAFEEADAAKRDLLREARAEVEANRRAWRDALDKDKETFLQELRQRVTEELYRALEKAVGDLADEAFERLVIRAFLKRLAALEPPQRGAFAQALRRADGALSVVTTFPLPAGLQDELKQTVKAEFGETVRVTLERDPALGCGVALVARDQKLAWTLASYVEGLEAAVTQQFATETAPSREAVAS